MTAPFRAADIASAFLPQRAHYWYSRCKLSSDPLYRGVCAALRDTQAPLLDLGCGIGLLAHTLRASGFSGAYFGVDNDAQKIMSACAAAERAGLTATRFETIDLANALFPAHQGSVALLDVLQFLPAAAGRSLLDRAAASVVPGGRLVIRTAMERTGARMGFTRAVDVGSRRIGWMNAAPHWYPPRDLLEALLARHALRADFSRLSGLLPFDNWVVVARHD